MENETSNINEPLPIPESNGELPTDIHNIDTKVIQDETLVLPLPFANPDWLRSFKGCENYSDEEALEISKNLCILAKILLACPQNDPNSNDNQASEYTIIILNNQKKAA
ncbi:MAG: hypothetical protein QM530_08025 [Phycisphaerales bacterium]|nr:hypothetical protein [Phycisphaerales bacterium]